MLRKQAISASRPAWLTVLSLLVIAALSLPASAQKVNITYLTSDIPSVGNLDAHLVNPWGMSIAPAGAWWISDNGTGLSTLYDGNGVPQSLVVTIPPAMSGNTGTPTGTVYNGSTTDFKIHNMATPFLFCTEDGTISGWYAGSTAFIALNNSSSGAVYKGMTINSTGGHNYLYVANFHAGTIEVYDGSFTPHTFSAGQFTDSSIPAGFAPFNVQAVGSNLIVTYAKQDAAKHDDVPGPGNGYVDLYDATGNRIRQMAHVLYLNSPWGAVQAPSNFSGFANDLLIGNFGSGLITAYNLSTGAWVGNMQNVADLPVQIDGLWGIAFGNGNGGGPTNTLYFTAGYFGEKHGIFGMITPHPGM